MAIDPTTPVTPIIPPVPAGTATDSAVLQAMARQALANATAQLSEIVGRPAHAAPKTNTPVEQAGQTSTQDTGHAADAPSAKGAATAQQTASSRLAPETRLARAVRTAAAEAVPRQTGLAPLMANVRAIVDRADMPIEVRQVGMALLAKATPAAEIATPQGLRRAVERSGVFLETHMAQAAAAPSSETAPRTVTGEVDMKAALLVFRGVLSSWLARTAPQAMGEPTLPAASPMLEAPEAGRAAPGAPPAVPGAASRPQPSQASVAPTVAGANTSTEPLQQPPTAGVAPDETLPAAATASAVEDAPPAVTSPPAPAAPAPADEEVIEPRFASFLAAPKSLATPGRPSTPAPTSPSLSQFGLIEEEPAPGRLLSPPPLDAKPLAPRGYGAASAEAARPKVPPPPYAGGPMAGQKPAASELPFEAPALEAVRRLLKGANGALARQDLLQIASLPEAHHDPETGELRGHGAHWNLDLPFMTPQGVAVAQFEISHDGGGSGGGAVGPAERTYRARFSIDVEPLGPVHALVTLTGARARVSLWAERAETIARLRAGEEGLGEALRRAELSPEVAVHSGAPPSPGVSALGHFVDQAS